MPFFQIESRALWGEYGDSLICGLPSGTLKPGEFELKRTGPFVPPVTSIAHQLVVTDQVRQQLSKAFGVLEFDLVTKTKIVRLEWHTWDLAADDPPQLPPGGNPENYVFCNPHSEETSKEIGDLWRPVLEEGARGRFLEGPGIRLAIDPTTWTGRDIFTVVPGMIPISVVTDKAKRWIEERAGEWVTFPSVKESEEACKAESLNAEQLDVVLAALKAIASGPFIDDAEFSARLGGSRDDVAALVRSWPDVNDCGPESMEHRLVNNCLNEVCHGLTFTDASWREWFTVSRVDVWDVFGRWRRSAQQ